LQSLIKDESIPVIRGKQGSSQSVSVWNLVVGDVILLETGARVPADCLLIEGADLRVSEMNLPVRLSLMMFLNQKLSWMDATKPQILSFSVEARSLEEQAKLWFAALELKALLTKKKHKLWVSTMILHSKRSLTTLREHSPSLPCMLLSSSWSSSVSDLF